ncbi:hypothetical protein ACCS81_08340 [Rhizobium ruizarguesonis]
MTMSDDISDDEDGGTEGAVGGAASSSHVPGFGKGPKKHVDTPSERSDEEGLNSATEDFDECVFGDEIDGPPAKLPNGRGKKLENGYSVVEWDDGFFYLYDDNGNLVDGERFDNETLAEERANELKPPGLRF